MAQLSHLLNSGLFNNIRLILKETNDPTVQNRLKRGLAVIKPLFKATRGSRLAFLLVISVLPVSAKAGFLNYLSDLLSGKEEIVLVQNIDNSQNMALLQAVINPDPIIAQGGGDIAIVAGTALLPEAGPVGTAADIDNQVKNVGHVSVYIVRKGDTLSQIAKMFGVTVNTLVWNNDVKAGLIKEGQTLVILPISGVSHIVKKGDTIASIAKKYKGDIDEIARYNGLDGKSTLAVGEVVIVPDGELALPTNSATVSGNPFRGGSGPEYEGYYLRPIIGGRKTQGLHGYNGVDLASYNGAPILASASGDVIVARSGGWNGGYGDYIVIKHDNGTQTLYAHASSIIVSTGQYVVRGQVIGYIGSTGKSTGPHLHFEIRGAKNPF